MDIHDLIVFQTVAKEQSISRAAQKLNYVQSNVTMRIQKLEKEIGNPLFHRHRRGVTLSAIGQTLLNYTQKILNLMDEASKAVKQESKQLKGLLKIGSIDSTLAARLPVVLSAFHESFPDVQICIETASTSSLIQAVLDYELEGAFVAGEINHPELAQQVVYQEELVVVRHASSQKWSADPANQSLIIFNQGCYYQRRLESWMSDAGYTPLTLIEFGSSDGKLECVKTGVGAAVVTKSMVHKLKDQKDFVIDPIPKTYSQVPTVFIRRKDLYTSKAVEEFLNIATSFSV